MKTAATLAMGVFLVLVSGMSANASLLESPLDLVQLPTNPVKPVPTGGSAFNGTCGGNETHNDSCEVGSGSILLGTLGEDLGTDRFSLDLNNTTYTVNNTTFTINNTSAGNLTVQAIASGGTAGILHDIDLYAFDENDNQTAACATGDADEFCTIAASTQTLLVVGWAGALLDVTVVVVSADDDVEA